MPHPVILFDGVCNLCNSAVQFIIRHDKQAVFRFASLQSEPAKKLLATINLSAPASDSILLIENDKVYSHSTAALRVAKRLEGPTKLLYGFIIVPGFIRNGVYKLIARNRYKLFGKRANCMVPSSGILERFLK